MDAVKFIQERNRMCATYTPKRCEGCPADHYGGEGVACIMVDRIDAERLVPIVESWAAAHPIKTRQDLFLEQWPEAMIESDGVIAICPTAMDKSYGKTHCPHILTKEGCDSCRSKFWGKAVKW